MLFCVQVNFDFYFMQFIQFVLYSPNHQGYRRNWSTRELSIAFHNKEFQIYHRNFDDPNLSTSSSIYSILYVVYTCL